MDWADSVRRTANGWAIEVVGADGNQRVVGLGELPGLAKSLKVSGSKRRKVSFDLSEGRPATAQEYVDGLDQRLVVSKNHEVYAFEQDGTRYLVPAIVLMGAFFRPFAPDIIKLFFRPQGLDLLCVPDLGAEKPTVKVFEGMWPRGYRQFDSHLAALSWMHCFHSGRVFAACPFEMGRHGVIGLTLPKATAKMVLHGVPKGSAFFVTEVVVTSLVANEEPFDCARCHTTEISLHEGRAPDTNQGKVQRVTHPELSHRIGRPVTDTEWAAIEQILPRPKASQQVHPRQVVDCILRKMSEGLPWRQASSEYVSSENARQHYARWLQLGVWDKMSAMLQSQ